LGDSATNILSKEPASKSTDNKKNNTGMKERILGLFLFGGIGSGRVTSEKRDQVAN